MRWLDRLLRSEGATSTAIADDRELTKVEDVTGRLALVGSLASAAAMALTVAGSDADHRGLERSGSSTLGVTVVVFAVVMRVWARGHMLRRLLRPDRAW